MPIATRALQEAVARDTVARRRRGEKRKLYLDHLIERVEGRTLEEAELELIKTKIGDELRTMFSAQ